MREIEREESQLLDRLVRELDRRGWSISRALIQVGHDIKEVERHLKRIENDDPYASIDWTDDDYQEKLQIVEFYNW